MADFIDQVKIQVKGGKGGHGCVSVRREKFKPLGGPDGGSGGNGGAVIFKVDQQSSTLAPYYYSQHQKATNGGVGKGSLRHGKDADNLILPVPAGTVLTDGEGHVLVDLVEEGQEYIAAHGGQGGLGNAALASKNRKAPGFALLGLEGEEAEITAELKSIADVALVGFPSAGKSSLISAISASKPKIADYPFTTLKPNLGVVEAGTHRYTVADVPGLIPDASEGKGLGYNFLRHIDRCSAIVHVIDCGTLERNRDPLSDLEVIEKELEQYSDYVQSTLENPEEYTKLLDRPQLVILNKMDIPDAQELADFMRPALEEKGYEIFEISTVDHRGLKKLSYAMGELVEREKSKALQSSQDQDKEKSEKMTLRPQGFKKKYSRGTASEFTISVEQDHHNKYSQGVYYRIVGDKPERWVKQTDFANDEAVGYLSDRFNKLGIEDRLFKAGATAGATVVIGSSDGVIFDWEPTITAGAELLASPRGTDARLEEVLRPTRSEKKEAQQAKANQRAEGREKYLNALDDLDH